MGLTATDTTQMKFESHTNSLHVPSVGDLNAGAQSLNQLLAAMASNHAATIIESQYEGIDVCVHICFLSPSSPCLALLSIPLSPLSFYPPSFSLALLLFPCTSPLWVA